MPPLHPLLLGFLVALGVGLLIGIDRERQKGDGPAQQAAGLRTFTLASLAGAVAMAGRRSPAAGRGEHPLSVVPILATLTTNTITRAGFAIGAGGRLFALYVIPGLS